MELGLWIAAYQRDLGRIGIMALQDTLHGALSVALEKLVKAPIGAVAKVVGISERTVKLVDYALTIGEISHSRHDGPTIYDRLLQEYRR